MTKTMLFQLPDAEKEKFFKVKHFPWMNSSSSSCKNYSIALGNVSTFSMDSLVALASIPSSGNTWVRSIIEEATGVFTGSMYEVRYQF